MATVGAVRVFLEQLADGVGYVIDLQTIDRYRNSLISELAFRGDRDEMVETISDAFGDVPNVDMSLEKGRLDIEDRIEAIDRRLERLVEPDGSVVDEPGASLDSALRESDVATNIAAEQTSTWLRSGLEERDRLVGQRSNLEQESRHLRRKYDDPVA